MDCVVFPDCPDMNTYKFSKSFVSLSLCDLILCTFGILYFCDGIVFAPVVVYSSVQAYLIGDRTVNIISQNFGMLNSMVIHFKVTPISRLGKRLKGHSLHTVGVFFWIDRASFSSK